jgi:hypothetical protein
MASTGLSRTCTQGNNKTATLSVWLKRAGGFGSEQYILGFGLVAGAYTQISFDSSDNINVYNFSGGGVLDITSYAKRRDPAAWLHFCVAFDSSQNTESNRIKYYINGTQVTGSDLDVNYPALNADCVFNNNGQPCTVGMNNSSSGYYNGSMAMMEWVDGLQLDPTYFGSFDSASGIWTPTATSTISDYGVNGFKLAMDTSTPGADTSGKGNTFTASGTPTLTQGNPQNNWCNLNSLEDYYQATTLSNGNTTLVGGGSYAPNTGTIGLTKGKWYWETKVSDWQSSNGSAIGVSSESATAGNYEFYNQSGTNQGYGYFSNGSVYGGATLATGYGTGAGTHYIGVAIDLDNNKIAWSYDGAFQGSANPVTGANMLTIAAPSTLATGTYFPAFTQKDQTKTFNVNFGEGFFGTTAAGTNADDNGQGLFAYDVPAGYYAINTKNLEAYG